ncbi:hypothetical protein LPJ75_005370, partial [Coemansia sp. RSA 2598]
GAFAHVQKPTTSTSNATPIVNRVGTTDSHTNKHKPVNGLMKERKAEVDYAFENRFMVHNDIINMLAPKCSSKRAEAQRVASLVTRELEGIAKGDEKLSDIAAASEDIEPVMFGNDSVDSSDTSKNSSSSSTSIDDMRVLKLIQKPIAGKDAQPVPRFRRESEMYPAIASLFRLVERLICKFAISQDSTQKTSPSQSVKVYEKADFSPKDSDNYLRIDVGLFISDMWKRPAFNGRAVKHNKGPEIGAVDPKYADIFAVVEAKVSEDDQVDAYKQLLLYTYNIYWRQHDRRFAWGLTVCGTAVRACVFGNDGFLASDKMDLSEADGRSAFVGLLVNMAYCGREQLGFDLTIRYNSVRSMWEIDVFNDSDGTKTTCEIVSVMQAAERIFGRHTRCFRCKLPDDENESDNDSNSNSDNNSNGLGHFIVKDAWAYAEGDPDSPGFRDE